MLFNTLDFLIFFFPVVLAVFYLVPTAWRLYVLFIASAVFYGYSGAVPLAFMLLSILWAYGFAFVYRAFPGRAVVFLSILFPFLILFLFKYLNFTLDNFGADAETRRSFSFFLDILLPAGISFYTFQIMAYSIDVARGRVPVERNLLSLATFISFFPQLIAGPILRYEQLRDQLHALVSRRDVDHDFVTAAKFIAVGLFGKVFVADVFVLLAGRYDPATNGSAVDTAFVVLADSMIIYFDFWAYSIIAIGLGRCFGIRLPRNFREPYVAASPRDFGGAGT